MARRLLNLIRRGMENAESMFFRRTTRIIVSSSLCGGLEIPSVVSPSGSFAVQKSRGMRVTGAVPAIVSHQVLDGASMPAALA